jgi:glycosyltransferase involved in cell wall biosynthesis
MSLHTDIRDQMGEPLPSPTVSIIIPCYRQAHFLCEAVDSALAQTYKNIEIIVVNDGSDDNTHEVAARYASRTRYVCKANGGLASARNAGIDIATGDYFLFLDADDALHPDAVAWLVEAIDRRADRLCMMGYQCFVDSPDRPEGVRAIPRENASVADLIIANFGPPHCYLSSSATVRRIGAFDTDLNNSCEDWDLWCRLLYDGAELITLPKIGAYYRIMAGSMSTNAIRMNQQIAEVRRRSLKRLTADSRFASRLDIGSHEVSIRLKRHISKDCFHVAYCLRNCGAYSSSALWHLRSICYGTVNLEALRGLALLLPHWLLTQAGVLSN